MMYNFISLIMAMDKLTTLIAVSTIYVAVLSICVARFAFSEKTKDDPHDILDYTAMVLLSPFFIVHRSGMWIYNNW
jgi:hypothetical protein